MSNCGCPIAMFDYLGGKKTHDGSVSTMETGGFIGIQPLQRGPPEPSIGKVTVAGWIPMMAYSISCFCRLLANQTRH